MAKNFTIYFVTENIYLIITLQKYLIQRRVSFSFMAYIVKVYYRTLFVK